MTSIASLFNGKHAVMAVVLVFVPMLPALVLAPLGWSAVIGPFLLATIGAMMAALFGGVRLALLVTVGFAVAEMVALPAASSAVWAGVVMALTSLVYGLTARRGLSAMIVVAPEGVAFLIADPPSLGQGSMLKDALTLGLFVVIGGVWGTGFGAFLGRKLPRKTPTGFSWRTTILFAVTMAVVTGVAMGVVVASGIGHTGAWILLTLFLVIQPVLHQTFRKALERALGTVLGFGIALAVALIVRDATVLLVLGMLFLTLAVYVKLDPRAKYWHFTMFLTPGIVLAEGASANVVVTDIDRLWASLVGVLVALAVLAVFRLVGMRDDLDATKQAPTPAT